MTMPIMPRVYSKRKGAAAPPPGAVYVGRPSRWGNPFKLPWGHPSEVTRRDVIERFRAYAEQRLKDEPGWLEPLRGRDLVCHCAPLLCHGDVLLELANREVGQ